MDNILYLFLGWLLGLFSPIIAETVKRKRETDRVCKAIFTELNEVKIRLAYICYQTEMRFGTIDRAWLQWMHDIVSQYSDGNHDSFLKFLKGELALNDEQIAINAKANLANGKGIILKKFLVPHLDSRISTLWFFNGHFQKLLLEIQTNLNLLNEDVDQNRYYFRLTFTKLEEKHRTLVENNLFESYKDFARRARIIIQKIVELEKTAKGKKWTI